MAAYIGHVLSTVGPKLLLNSTKTLTILPCRHGSYNKKVKKNPKNFIRRVQFEGRLHSIRSSGFLRNLPPYQPPENVAETVLRVFEEKTGSKELNTELNNDIKYEVLIILNKELNHCVPNSLLFDMKTIGDVLEFYHTPNTDITPFDKFKEMKLPPNLHITFDYHRFHPDIDTKFGGVSAFPRSSTLVTGLKYKKKYKGYTVETPWDDI